MTDALIARGNEIKEEMVGPERGAAKLERATDFTRPFEELVCKYRQWWAARLEGGSKGGG